MPKTKKYKSNKNFLLHLIKIHQWSKKNYFVVWIVIIIIIILANTRKARNDENKNKNEDNVRDENGDDDDKIDEEVSLCSWSFYKFVSKVKLIIKEHHNVPTCEDEDKNMKLLEGIVDVSEHNSVER